MSKNKITILLLGCTGFLIAGFGFLNFAEAANSSIYVSPASLNKEVGDTFDISVKINPAGEKICVVEGKLNLDKLSCDNIAIGDGLSVQTSPSCGNLNFLLGIQGCITEDKTLFTATVKAESSGEATANFSGVDLIGEGISVSSVSSGGIYILTVHKEEEVPQSEEVISEEEIETEEIEEVETIEGDDVEEEILSDESEEEILEEEITDAATEGESAQVAGIAVIWEGLKKPVVWIVFAVLLLVVWALIRAKKRSA